MWVSNAPPNQVQPIQVNNNVLGFRGPGGNIIPFRLNSIFGVGYGDSRMQMQYTGQRNLRKNAQSFLNWAISKVRQKFKIVYNAGVSGFRTDQYLADSIVTPGRSVKADVALFGFPIVNDLSYALAGYTIPAGNPYAGTVVTLANVADVAFRIIRDAVYAELALGRFCIISLEPGANNLTIDQVRAMHLFNFYLKVFQANTSGVFLNDPTSALWDTQNNTNKQTLTFKAGILATGDPTHYSSQGGAAGGDSLATILLQLMTPTTPRVVTLASVASTNNSLNSNALSLLPSPLFTTISPETAGTSSGGIVVTGTIPANWAVTGPATQTVTVTISADPSGNGNQVRLQGAATAAGTLSFSCVAPNSALYNLTDQFECFIDCDVAAGSSHAMPMLTMELNTNLGTNVYNDLEATVGKAGPATAYSLSMGTEVGFFMPGSTSKGYIIQRFQVMYDAAGNIDCTVRLPEFNRYIPLPT